MIIALPIAGWAQGITVVGLPHSKNQKTSSRSNARTQAITLPLWEDFSSTKTTFANPDLWLYGQSIRVNDGMAILPPSLKVATFDGIDSVGSPYSVTDVLAKGYADKLVSQSIDLTTVPENERNTVWLSYMYQMKGNGEIPDSGDRLVVLFLDDLGEWIPVDTIENDGSIEPDIFYTSFVQVADEKYFHADFKFRIQNFGRLSGPYDTWHVDYIYLNKGRIQGNDKFNWFPDRTISEPATGLFGIYRSVPIKHFLLTGDSLITQPDVIVTNNRPDQVPEFPGQLAGQPVGPVITTRMGYRVGTETQALTTFGPDTTKVENVTYQQYRPFTINKVPDFETIVNELNGVDGIVDSLGIELEIGVNTDDNNPNFSEGPGDKIGDFDPNVWGDIDFRRNDTTITRYDLMDKYAYDDGIAEYGAGLNQPGAMIAYKYTLVGVQTANIKFLEMYFPRFGDESSQVIELRIWKDLSKDPVYTETTTLQRSEDNIIWRKPLTEPLGVNVDSVFYIGWKQSVSAIIAVGLDKNTDTGDRMYYNTNGDWVQNTLIHGSLLLRPVMDEGIVSGVEDEAKDLVVYPNPGSGTFYFNGVADMISVYDMTGRSIPIHTETTTNETKLVLSNASFGIYIIKAHVDGRVKTAKVMVR